MQTYHSYIKTFKATRIYSTQKYQIFLKGNIYHDTKNLVKLIINSYKRNKMYNLPNQFNGNYIIFFYDCEKKFFFSSNSQTSYLDIFYSINKKRLILSHKINKFLKFKNSTNNYRAFEWLILGGRALTNETFINNVYYLLPGETISIDKDKNIKVFEKNYLSYKQDKKKITAHKLVKSLKKAVNIRITSTKEKTLLGLSGGMDSRILAGLADNKNVITYTYGHISNFEKIFAQYISSRANFKKHVEIDIKDKEYFPDKVFNDYIKIGNLNSTFQHNHLNKLFQNLSKKFNSKKIMLGCALDLFLGSSFSDEDLYKIKNLNSFYLWFKKKYFLFSEKEIKKIFPTEYSYFYKKIRNNFFKLVSKFEYKNFIDLNDALHFEIRILRWYNRNLNFLSYNDRTILAPTYDKNFLTLCFKTNYKLRVRDFYRKDMLKYINKDLYEIPTLSSFLPPSADQKYQKTFRKILNSLENLNSNSDNLAKIPSLLYDVNLSRIILKSKDYYYFKNKILKKFKGIKKSNTMVEVLNKEIFFSNKNNSLSKIKKMIFLLSFYNTRVYLNDKK